MNPRAASLHGCFLKQLAEECTFKIAQAELANGVDQKLFAFSHGLALQPRRFTIAPSADGCKRLLGGSSSATLFPMTIKARVREGRLIVDEPTDLPEGTELQLLPLDPGDWLDETDRAALHEALRESDADVAAGRLVDAEEILKELRSR